MLKKSFLGVLSLILVGFGQPGWIPHFAPLAAVCGYALFWRAFLIFPSAKKRFWVAVAWFALVQSIQLSWMTSCEYQGVYILFVYAFLAFALGVQFGFISLLIPKEGGLRLSRCLMLASVWTLFEWVRYHVICGFTFSPTGLALGGNTLSLQFAAIFGVLGLSFWVMLTNGLAFNVIRKKALFSWVVVAAVPYLFGWGHISFHQSRLNQAPKLNVVLIQPGLLPPQKVPLTGRLSAFIPPLEQWSRIFSLIKQAKLKTNDLIALPEAALPFHVDQAVYPLELADHLIQEELGPYICPSLEPPFASMNEGRMCVTNAFFVQAIANHYHSEVVAGFDGYDPLEDKHFNAAYHFLPFSKKIERYDKRMLMPVAEYLPYKWTRKLAAAYGITQFFEPGVSAKVFQGKVPFSVSICYDETFPHLVREGRLNGSSLLVTVTNDNWYPESRLPKQHFDLGRLRTVENGAPLIRACNSGITGGVDSLGRVVSKLGNGDSSDWLAGSIAFQISTYHYAPPYFFWGNSGILILVFFLIGFLLILEKRKVNRRQHNCLS